jgi:hypothetical protein
MVFVFLVLAVGLFIAALKILGLVPRVRQVISASSDAVSIMKSTTLGEDEKEVAMKQAAVQMFASCGAILVRVAVLLAVPLGFVLLGAQFGLYTNVDLIRASTNWIFITGSTIIMIGALFVVK